MKNVLVTGGCGLIGERVSSGLLKKGYRVIAVDNEPSRYNEEKENYLFIKAAPNDKEAYTTIFQDEVIEIVVHLACSADNDFGYTFGEREMEISRSCNKFIYKLASIANVEAFLLLSTTQVYQKPTSREPVREEDYLNPVTNYGMMKLEAEQALAFEFKKSRTTACAIMRTAPVYTKNYYQNLIPKITDPKDGMNFVYRTGEYGFQFCCVHNISDFILCYIKHDDEPENYTGIYNICDKNLVSAEQIIVYMKENHRIGPVLQRKEKGKDAISTFFTKMKTSKEEKTDYHYLDFDNILSNIGFSNIKASKLCPFRWNIENTK